MVNPQVSAVKEHFLGFVHLSEMTGLALTEAILQQLKDMALPIEN